MPRPASIVSLVLTVALIAQESRPAPDDAEVAAAIAHATKLLAGFQENYVDAASLPGSRPRNRAAREEWEAQQKKKAEEESKKLGPPREWPYEGVHRVDGLIPPGYRVGGTAIACWALLESPGFEQDDARRETFRRGIAFILEALAKEPMLQSGFEGTYDTRGWGHSYGLRTLLRALERDALDPETRTSAAAMVRTLLKTLEETEIPKNGGWNYARSGPKQPCEPSTFMTAPTLQALFQARKQGFEVPAPMIERAIAALEKARLESGAFQYATSGKTTGGKGFESLPGACARMAVCETTLHFAGRGSVDRIRAAVGAFFEHWEHLEKRRKKQGTHVPPYLIAPYYFHYAHTYVAQAIEQLPEGERPELRKKLRALYWMTREKDGGWNDRVFPRSEGYGTAMAILGLLMPSLPPPARYEPK